jgi:hypothetical protein
MPEDTTAATPEIALIVRNKRPIPAADLGSLLTDLATDYQRLYTGRTLVVVGLETGSIITMLQEAYTTLAPYGPMAIDVLHAAKNLSDFVTLLKGIIGTATDPKKGWLSRKKKRPGDRSAERLLQIALKTDGEVELQRRSPDGEELALRVTSGDAIRIRDKASARPIKTSGGDATMSGVSVPAEWAGGNALTLNSPSFNEPLLNLDDIIAATRADSSGADALFKALAKFLREAGVGFDLLELLALKLERTGQPALAAAARASIKQSR